MKLSTIKYIFVLAILSIFAFSCKVGEVGPEGAKGTDATLRKGNIIGFANAFTEAAALLPSFEGTSVLLEGNGLSKTVSTNAEGKYEFTDIPVGTYNFTFTRTGFGTRRIFGKPHAGGSNITVNNAMQLVANPSLNITSVTLTPSGNNINGSGTTSGMMIPGTTNIFVVAFISTSNTVSNTNYMLATSSFLGGTNTNFTSTFLNVAQNFPAGTQLYFRVYGASSANFDIDYATGRRIYSNLGTTPSPVATVTLP